MKNDSDRNALCSFENLRFKWGSSHSALLNVPEFSIFPGEKILLRGPSGAGKSTFLSLLAGIVLPSAGKAIFMGKDWRMLGAGERDTLRANHMGYIFQQFNLIPYLNSLENVLLALTFAPERRKKLEKLDKSPKEESLRLLAALGLNDMVLLQKKAKYLSVGQQQRVACARALLGQPELLLADEPTSALDPANRDGLLSLLFSEVRKLGTAVFFVSHDPALSVHFDRCVELSAFREVGE